MKASELMIGDWVQNQLGWKAQVQSIRYVNTIKDEWEWLVKIGINNETFQNNLSLNEIGAIPLTPEILQKNGFVYNAIPFVDGWEQFGLTLYRSGNGYSIDCGIKVSLIIDCVHQLQHALRLCGVEKEITI